jgi:hypothetical protein
VRYVIARVTHYCAACHKIIPKGTVCIDDGFGRFYHCVFGLNSKDEDCHKVKFNDSETHVPRMTKTVKEYFENEAAKRRIENTPL